MATPIVYGSRRLAKFLKYIKSSVGGVMIFSDSNTYTVGGWQQALPMAFRNFSNIKGYSINFGGSNAFSGTAVPYPARRTSDDSTSDIYDQWSASGNPGWSGTTTTGAPSPQASLYPPCASNFSYIYKADNNGNTNSWFAGVTSGRLFSGLNVRRAITWKLHGVSFASAVGTDGLGIYVRNNTNIFDTFTSETVMNFVTGSVARFTFNHQMAASAARDPAHGGNMIGNVFTKATQPVFLFGNSIVDTDLTNGVVFGIGMDMGGCSSAENFDDFIKSRENYRTRVWQMKENVGATGKCLCLLNFINDKSLRTTAATPKFYGLVTGGTSTTVTFDNATGIVAGNIITIRDATTDTTGGGRVTPIVTGNELAPSLQDRTVLSVAGNTVTVTSAFTRTPVAGDVWRGCPAGETTPTKAGRKNTLTSIMKEVRADLAAVGQEALFVDITQWPVGDSSDLTVQLFQDAAKELYAENADYVGVCGLDLFSSDASITVANTAKDSIHPGSYFLSVLIQRAFSQALSEVNSDTLAFGETMQEPFSTTISLPTANTFVAGADINPDKNVTRLAASVVFTDSGGGELQLRLWGKVSSLDGSATLLINESDMGRFVTKGKAYPVRPGTSFFQINLEVDRRIVGIWDSFYWEVSRSPSSDGSASVTIRTLV